jgi:hypothetical protein
VPAVCDLTRDDTARRLLAALLLRPFDAELAAVLADRADELGEAGAACLLRQQARDEVWPRCRDFPRRHRQRIIRAMRASLVSYFGDPAPLLEANSLPVEVPEDTPLPF